MLTQEFPILEFDEDRNAMIRPSSYLQPMDIAEGCVLCFFAEAIEALLARYPHTVVHTLNSESSKQPVYELHYKGKRIALTQAMVGAPMAAGQIEELSALGCRKFIVCGGCGVLRKDIAVGHLIIPVSAVRDEGTSYHYVKPAREIALNERVIRVIEDTLTAQNVPYITAKTWTTDAFFRETPAKITRRKAEGCITVEMETAAYAAAAQYNAVDFGQILYAGDNLGGEAWDKRDWHNRSKIRELVLRLALDACIRL